MKVFKVTVQWYEGKRKREKVFEVKALDKQFAIEHALKNARREGATVVQVSDGVSTWFDTERN